MTAAKVEDYPFADTLNAACELVKTWEQAAKEAPDAMERVVLYGCAREVLGYEG